MVPFTPRLIPAILPNLAHHAPDIQAAAIKTNQLLFNVIQNLPASVPSQSQGLTLPSKSLTGPTSTSRSSIPLPAPSGGTAIIMPSSSPPVPSPLMNRQTLDSTDPPLTKPRAIPPNLEQATGGSSSNSSLVEKDGIAVLPSNQQLSRPGTPTHDPEKRATLATVDIKETLGAEPFDYHATVSALTIRFLSEFEDTRVAALKWLIMLHQKLPNKASIHRFYTL